MPIPTSASLNTEIMTDPKGLGYGAFVSGGNDTGLTATLNSTYATVGIVYRMDLMPQEVLKSLVWTELSTKTQVQIEILQLLLQPRQIDASQQNIRDIFVGLFPSGSTIANLTAVAKVVNPSRAQELWGADVSITIAEVAKSIRTRIINGYSKN